MPSIDWKLRDILPHLRDNGRLNVLMALILRANVRARCYPSIELICKDTGYAVEAVNTAKKWLIDHGAIEMVPYDKRVGKECDLPPRQSVYQLTGELVIDKKTYPYLYVAHTDISPTEISDIDILSVEISPTEDEVVKSLKSLESSKSRKDKEIAPVGAPADVPLQGDPHALLEDGTKTFPLEGKNSTRKENSTRKPTKTTAKEPPIPDGAKPLSPAARLGEAYGVMPAGKRAWAQYGTVASALNDATIPCEEFDLYIKWTKRESKNTGEWEVTITALMNPDRMSKYVAARNAHKGQGRALGGNQVVSMLDGRKNAYNRNLDPAYAQESVK